MPKRSTISFFVLSLSAIAFVSAGCSRSQQGSQTLTQTAGDLTVSFTTQPSPPHSGEDVAIVTIMSNGQPVNDASVVATANMRAPKLPGPLSSGRFQGNGQYQVPLRLVATTYDVDVHIERQRHAAVDVTFSIEAWQ
jgi:hypothetical protein